MLATWGAIKKSLSCDDSNASDVYDPVVCRRGRSGYSRNTISRLKGVVDGSNRHRMNRASQSPLSVRSSDLLNPITHQVRFSNAVCELKITRLDGGSPGPRMFNGSNSTNWYRSSVTCSEQTPSLGPMIMKCENCGEILKKHEDTEAHHLSKHAVTELVGGDPSRNVIERIVGSGQSNPENWVHKVRILKVHNLQTTLAQFEEYREMVKIRGHNLSKKHPRCLADGNELLRFYATTFTCSLGEHGSPSLCSSDRCRICCTLKHGFTAEKVSFGHFFGVLTASTAEEACKYMQLDEEKMHPRTRKALILCRVIAGRVQKPMDQSIEKAVQPGFDSLAGMLGSHYSIGKLYSMEAGALLPCFVILCKT